MDIRIEPSRLTGSVRAISSKSDAHRLLICAALADRETVIERVDWSEDIGATARCLAALGAQVERAGDALRITPIETPERSPVLDCGESGSTLRFLLPVAAALHGGRFVGRGRLPDRPQEILLRLLAEHGAAADAGRLPLTLSGGLRGGRFTLPGNVSSQYVSGLLFALPLLPEGGEIFLSTPLQSAGYVEMTLRSLKRFGVRVERTASGYLVPGGQKYRSPGELSPEGDWSNAAFFLAAGVEVTGLDRESAQGDRAVERLLPALGGGAVVDLEQIPDLLPILAVAAARAQGVTRFVGGGRLRIKESDRIESTAALLRALGVEVETLPDGLTVHGGSFAGGLVDGANDHRIVMAAAIAAVTAKGAVTIRGAEAVAKSYPRFFEDLKSLGGIFHVL